MTLRLEPRAAATLPRPRREWLTAIAVDLGAHRRPPGMARPRQPVRESDAASVPLQPLVAVVDDDDSVRESLPDLLAVFGFSARAFASAEDFLDSDCVERADCLVLDISMPGMTGPELQKELASRRHVPVVFISAHADVTMRSRVMNAGAVACLSKPFSETSLLAALNKALGKDT